MSDRDPGDENDDLRDYPQMRQRCLFCDVKLHYNNHHVTPLYRWTARPSFSEAVSPLFETAMASREELHTCAALGCREQARKFVEQQQLPGSRKQAAVFNRWSPWYAASH